MYVRVAPFDYWTGWMQMGVEAEAEEEAGLGLETGTRRVFHGE